MSSSKSLWYQNAIFYEVNVHAFYDSNCDGHGDLAGLAQKLDYLKELGIDCLWLLPIFPSPLKDDGYDISDYRRVAPLFGTLDDLKVLLDAVHANGMRLIMDLVLNHTSDQHPWFQAARADRKSPYRDYYVWSDSDQKYKEARIIFLDTEESNWTWDEKAGQYYWHRFYASQPDLNYDNPAVQQEMLDIIKAWLDLGIDGFRADAVPYLFERENTNCENLPETHQYIKKLRSFMDLHYPGRILLCEVNQWPENVRTYFGKGDEFHMGFHFPLMPRIFMSLAREDLTPIAWILERTPAIPADCQWCTFLRNHDELTLEMVTEADREWMWQRFAPERRMRLNLGIRRRLAPLLDNDQRRIELANSLLLSLPGSPIIYYGDEIGMGDNIWLFDRNGVRTPMQWENGPNAGFSTARPEQLYEPLIETSPYGPETVNVEAQKAARSSLYNMIRRMITVRKQHTAFATGSFAWEDLGRKQVAAYWRSNLEERLLVLNNLSAAPQLLEIPLSGSKALDLLAGNELFLSQPGRIDVRLAPYQYRWMRIS